MIVISWFKLVLDNNPITVPVLSNEVNLEVSSQAFSLWFDKGDIDRFRQIFHIRLKP